jgi:23S rRNA (uracil1939-C5)-methyltransferase
VVEALAARGPATLVYVSCDPPTLGRDLALFAARGYRPDAVHLFDQFPKTFHIETVVRLRRV